MNESLELIEYNSSIVNSSSLIVNEELQELENDLPPGVAYTLIVIGTVGNSLVCLTILLDKKLQNLTNYFLFSLAVTDLLVGLVIIPARMATRRRFQPKAFPWCILYLVGDDYITIASAVHICFISTERYFAIKNPFDRRNLSKKRVAIKVSLVWIISLLAIIPYLTLAIVTPHQQRTMFCPELLANFLYFKVLVFIEAMVVVVMIIVVVVSFIMTSILLRKLVRRQKGSVQRGDNELVRTVGGNKSVDKSNDKKNSQLLLSEQKALRVVWIVSFAFIISLGPYACTSLFYLCFPSITIPKTVLEVTAYLSYANSVINPIIYTIFNKSFRKDFKNLLMLKCKLK